MDKLSPKARALREKLQTALHNTTSAWVSPVSNGCDCGVCERAVVVVAHIIVEELGITENDVEFLQSIAGTDRREHFAGSLATKFSTLLEIADLLTNLNKSDTL